MHTIVRKTLEIYLSEKRVPTLSDFSGLVENYSQSKEAVFVTLYLDGKVIASSGRIIPNKENTLYECIDNTLLCLKDPRATVLTRVEDLARVTIRTDRFAGEGRRVLRSIDELDTTKEGLIFLSQNLGLVSVVLPHMPHVDTTPGAYLALACKKISVDISSLTNSDYVIYGLTTVREEDL